MSTRVELAVADRTQLGANAGLFGRFGAATAQLGKVVPENIDPR
jgi:hypothetical protein